MKLYLLSSIWIQISAVCDEKMMSGFQNFQESSGQGIYWRIWRSAHRAPPFAHATPKNASESGFFDFQFIWRRLLRANSEGGVALCFMTFKEGIGLQKKIVQLYRCRIRSPIQWRKNEIHSSPQWGARSKRVKWKSEFWVLVGWRKSEIVCRETYNHRRGVKISGNVFWMISDRVVGLVLQYYRYKPPLLRYFIRSLALKIIC